MSSVSRIQRSLTLEEFLALPEEKPSLEYVDGRIEAKVSPQKKHGMIEHELTESLNRFARPLGLGLAIPELRCTYAGRSIVPDVVFCSTPISVPTSKASPRMRLFILPIFTSRSSP